MAKISCKPPPQILQENTAMCKAGWVNLSMPAAWAARSRARLGHASSWAASARVPRLGQAVTLLSMPSWPLAPSSPDPHHRRDILLAVVVASFSGMLLAVLAFLLLLFCLYRSLRRASARDPTLPLNTPFAFLLLLFCLYRSLRRASARDPTLPLNAPFASSLLRFSFRDLRSATTSFDPSRSLGRGASAVVFRGILPDGKSVAVKRLGHPSSSSPSSSPPQTSSDRKFHNELHVLADLPPSPFVISLLGYYLDSPHRRLLRLLIYEYMPNGSLQDTLFSSFDHHLVLNWDRRFSIVLDVAQALAFLSWDRRLGSGLGAKLARQAT